MSKRYATNYEAARLRNVREILAGKTVSPIVERAASGPGALSGFEARCSCGLLMGSAFRGMLEQDIAQHLAWHERQARALRA